MEKIKTLKIHHFAFLSAIFLVFVFVFTTHVFAASTSTKTPGEIIDSKCPSGNVGCILKTSISLTLKEISVSLSSISDDLSSGWSTFTNELIDNSENGIHNDKELIITLGNVSSSTSSSLSSGWSIFTNELIDNSINSLTVHKQYADNLQNNLTKGTLAYTNGILNIPDQTGRAFSSTKDLGLATTASVGDSLLGVSNGISDGWVSFTNTLLNNLKESFNNTKDLAVSIWNNITSIPSTLKNGVETFIATLNGPTPTTPTVVLPPSLVTTSITPKVVEQPTETSPVPTPTPTPTPPKVVTSPIRSITNNITQQQRDVIINQYDPSILPRIQGIELALQNSISYNTNQTDRVYDSIISSINNSSNNITEEGTLNKTTLRTPRISDGTLSGTTIIGLVEAPGTLTINEPTTLNNNISQAGAYTLSTGTGAISLNGDVTLSANNSFTQNGTGTFSTGTGSNTLNGNTEVTGSNTFKVGTGLTTLGGDLTVTGTNWTTTPTISGLITATSGLTSNGTVTIQNNSNFIQSGTGTFSTGTGAVSLNGNTEVTGTNTFTTGTGAVLLNGNTEISGSNTFKVGTGTSTFGGNIIASTGGIDIGTVGTPFGTIYSDSITANNIYGTIATGNTSSDSWIVNFDNATADTENSNIAFERGSLTPNALFSWDSTAKAFTLNSELIITNTITTGPNSLTLPNDKTLAWKNSTNTGTTTFIKSTTADDLQFSTNGVSMTILSGGNTGIGTTNPRTKLELGGDGSLLATGSYGSGWTEPNLGAGTRMFWYPKKAAFRAGSVDSTQWNDVNIGIYSTAMGYGTKASGSYSIAMGESTTASGGSSTAMGHAAIASGGYSTAMGQYPTASGNYSTAMGQFSTASGSASTAMGLNTTASGDYSTAMGQNTKASSSNSFAIGRYNVGGGTAGSWVATDPLFEIGNGTGTGVNASNALTVLKNGHVGIGTTDATSATLVIKDGVDAAGTYSAIIIGKGSGYGFTTFSQFYNTVSDYGLNINSQLVINKGSGNVGIGTAAPLSKLSINGGLHVGGDSDAGDNNILADGTITGTQLISNVATGTSPFSVTSTTLNTNLNADLLDGQQGSYYAPATGGSYLPLAGGTMTGGITNSTSVNPLTTLAESWIGPSSTTGIYFKGGNVGIGTTTPNNTYQGLTIYGSNPSLSLSGSSTSSWEWTQYMTSAGVNNFSSGVNQNNGVPYYGIKAGAGLDSPSFAINASGNVGIGTTGPIAKLDISGGTGDAAAYDPQLSLSRFSSTGNNQAFKFRLVANATSPTIWGDLNILRKSTASSAESDSYYTSALYVNGQNGNVGIGTTTPASKLEIMSAATAGVIEGLRLTNPQNAVTIGDGVFIRFQNTSDSNVNRWASIGSISGDYYGQNVGLNFSTNTGSSAPTEKMRILGNGNVGIGTAAPGDKLHVAVSSDTFAGISIENTSTSNNTTKSPAIDFYGRDTANTQKLVGRIAIMSATANWLGNDFNPNEGGGIAFFPKTGSGALTETVRFQENGNVGIGTTSPGQKLEVNGNIISAPTSGGYIAVNGGGVSAPPAGLGYGLFPQSNIGLGLYSEAGGFSFWGGATPAQEMVISTTGNVGIGTTGPSAKLDVKSSGTGPTGGIMLQGYSSGNAAINLYAVNDFTGVIDLQKANVGYTMHLTGDGNSYLNGGNVGIGTTGPVATLHVVGTAKIQGATGADGVLALQPNTGGRQWNLESIGGSNFRIYDYSLGAERLRIDYNGNVGIGTTGPNHPLEVNKSNAGAVVGYFNNSNATNGYGVLISTAANNSTSYALQAIGGGGGLTVLSNGYVGIGTTNPLWPLSILSTAGLGNIEMGADSISAILSIFDRSTSAFKPFRIITSGTQGFYQDTSGNVGIGTTNPAGYKLNINGTGYLNTSAWVYGSDRRLKENISYFADGGLEKILQLKPAKFDYITGEKGQLGFIAQEVQTVIPEAVVITNPTTGMLGLKTEFITPYLVKAIQELNLKVMDSQSLDTTKATSLGSLIKNFLADATNGITDFYANRVRTKQICVAKADGTEFCADGDKLQAMAENSVDSSSSPTATEIEAARVLKINTDLSNAKTAAAAKVEADYTGASWSAFILAKEAALSLPEVVESQTPTELEANKIAKTEALNNAMALLVLNNQPSSISALTAAKGIAQGLIDANAIESTTIGDHIGGSLATLTAANNLATGTIADTQTVIDAEVGTLNTAITTYNAAIVPTP